MMTSSLLAYAAKVAKAIAAAIVCAAAYLVGILSGDQGLGDLTTVQWLGLVVFLGGAYGITWAVPNARRPGAAVVRVNVDAERLRDAMVRAQASVGKLQRRLDKKTSPPVDPDSASNESE